MSNQNMVITSTFDTCPKDGRQFVAVWVFNQQVWAETFKVIQGVLHRYCTTKDEFIEARGYEGLLTGKVSISGLHFVLKDEDV